MMQGLSPRRTRSLHDDRGAAFLLAVYVSALTLLLLGSVSLQRTTTEVRAAQLSRDLQQAFWYSEGALDSAVRNAHTNPLDSMKTIAIESLPNHGSVTAALAHAQIFNNNVDGENDREFKNEFNPYQTVTKKIVATGTSDVNGRRQSVAAYVVETGPLRGVWANGTVAVGAGAGVQPGDLFLSGDLYSAVGTVVSEIGENKELLFDGVIGVPPDLVHDETEEGWNAKLDHWSDVATPEIKGIKDGYELLHGLNESRDQVGGSYSDVSFVAGSGTSDSEHVAGTLSVGLADTPEIMSSKSCAAHVTLTSSTVVVDNNYECNPEEGSNTPGLDCDRAIKDRSKKKGAIIMCVGSLTPAIGGDPNQSMLDAMAVGPAHVIFRAPTTIVLTGSTSFDFTNKTLRLANGAGFPLTDAVVDFVALATGHRLKTDWNVSLGAKISGVSALGETVPVDILQAEASRTRKDRVTPYGIIFMKPGDQYGGSIYAPESLVVVRARDCGSAQDGCGSPLSMDYVVGDEVIVELESDTLQIGQSVASSEEDGGLEHSFLSWTNETPPVVDEVTATSGKTSTSQ